MDCPVGTELELDPEQYVLDKHGMPKLGSVVETPTNLDPDLIWIKWEDNQIGGYEYWWVHSYCKKV